MKKTMVTCFGVAFLVCVASCDQEIDNSEPTVSDAGCSFYVDPQAEPGGDGASEESAFSNLDDALHFLDKGAQACDAPQLMLLQGAYEPSQVEVISSALQSRGIAVREIARATGNFPEISKDARRVFPATQDFSGEMTSCPSSIENSSREETVSGNRKSFEPNENPATRAASDTDYFAILGISTQPAPYLKLDNYTTGNADWVLQNSGGNIYLRRSSATGSGAAGQRIAFRSMTAPKSAVEITGYENNGSGDGQGSLCIRNSAYSLILDGDEIDSWNGASAASFYLNQNSKGNIFLGPNGGNVGIGTTKVSGYKLAVNGNVHAREVVVDNETWADDVFEESYALMPLAEVEKYVERNGHLPDVPCAAEVEKKGVSLSEMQSTLLRKVEELTLHAIAQQKQLDELKRENAWKGANHE